MKRIWLLPASVVLVGGFTWLSFFRGNGGSDEIEYRYEAVARGELTRSISATGQIVALTSVDVKSKAGGIIERLAVDEGSVVKKGDLIAIIDPRDTRALYEQANADLSQAQARASQAESGVILQQTTSVNAVDQAKANLETAKVRMAKAEIEAKRQPTLTTASIDSAKAIYESAREEQSRYEMVTAPGIRRDAVGAEARARAEFDAAQSDFARQQDLLKAGYVAQAAVDRAKSAFEAAQATYNVAKQRLSTLDREIQAQQTTLRLSTERANAAYEQAKAGASEDQISQRNLDEARKAVRLAEVALKSAMDARINERIRSSELQAAKAGTVRSRVALQNAKVQLDSTTVVAPRDGVVTKKYLEEGTIIPPGASLFAQGTSIVQLSDVTRLFVECAVDEADISDVREGQSVRIVTEAFPGAQLKGKVVRVNPAAQTEQNITAIKVRVEIFPGYKVRVLPGFSATCEFLTLSKPGVLIVPMQAVQREGGKTYVKVKSSDPLKPLMREVKLGESGNNGVEVLEGVKEGEEVVTAEINLKELRDTQERMVEAMQGGGLAGGAPSMGRRPSMGGAGGGTAGAGGRGGTAGGGGAGGGGRGGQMGGGAAGGRQGGGNRGGG